MFQGGGLPTFASALEGVRPSHIAWQQRQTVARWVGGVIAIALFVIGCIGAGGSFATPALGWTTIALGGGAYIFTVIFPDFKQDKAHKFAALIAKTAALASFITIGTLGGIGILGGSQVGWGIVGTSLSAGLVYSMIEGRKNRPDR